MKEKVVVCRQRLPWFNNEIKCAIRTRRIGNGKEQKDIAPDDLANDFENFFM